MAERGLAEKPAERFNALTASMAMANALMKLPLRPLVATASFWSVLFTTGCGTTFSGYVAPRVVGRVLDATTLQPLAGVQVRRIGTEPKPGPGEVRKGAQQLSTPQPVRSTADGTFVLQSERALAVFRKIHWFSVSLSFELGHYEGFTTNFILGEASRATNGEPIVQAGDIFLKPQAK
jgi:hypothetical protein